MKDRHRLSLDAVEDFRHARRRAILQDLAARLKGAPDDLLSFDEIREKLKAQGMTPRGLREIALDAIVGSVGRYTDFNRHFLPRQRADESRWARVRAAMQQGRELPPIEVYQIGQIYFVKDGNHRISVARELGRTHIAAYVTEVHSRVVVTPDLAPDELIIASEYASFLEQTHLDELRPEADLRVTAAGQFETIANHIERQRYRLALQQGRAIDLSEAVVSWYDEIYQPIARIIRQRNLLRDFPGRTETDVYVWSAEHQAALEAVLDWPIATDKAVHDFVARHSRRAEHLAARVREQILDLIRPRTFKPGPPPGLWRQEHLPGKQPTMLFNDLLVALSGEATGWRALEQAIVIAQRDGGVLHGLHVVASEAEQAGETALAIRDEFERRCAAAGVAGTLAIDVGAIVDRICDRARWADLVVVSLAHPPPPQPIARLRSGFRDLIQRCPQPVLAVPGDVSPIARGLIAYDGSSRAEEALIIAAYLALRWDLALVVVTALEQGDVEPQAQAHAREYLQRRGVTASYAVEQLGAARAILAAAEAHRADLIIMGGYGLRPELEIVLGSTVDHVLRASQMPVLVCR